MFMKKAGMLKIFSVNTWFTLTTITFSMVMIMNSCSIHQSKLIPRDIIFGNPVKANPQISPDGKRLAYLAALDGVLNVWVKTIGADDDTVITGDKNRGIQNYFWAQNNAEIYYLQDVGGNENWRLYGVNIETKKVQDLTPFENVQVQITEYNKDYPNEMLIAMNKDNPQAHDVFRLNLTSGEMQLVAKNPGNYLAWVNAADLTIRGAIVSNADGSADLLFGSGDPATWQKIESWDSANSLTSGPLNITQDGKYLYLLDSNNANAVRLTRLDLVNGKTDVLAEDPQYDVSNVIIQPDTWLVQAAIFNKDRQVWKILDESIKTDIEVLSNVDKGDLFISDRDSADDTWIVGFTNDNGPVSFYAYDRTVKQATFLFYARPALKDYTLAKMEPISFKARDGMTIYGYITYPPDASGKHNLPMVLNVHGGPWYRDNWGYNPEAQWLANRGYVCLQINYRGSVGYGKDYLNAGDREWGGKMQYDLVDAVQWAIDKKIADPKRVAIYGGSYGGYASLVGATFTPDLYCCAVDIVGPSNLMTWINTIPPYWSSFRNMLYKRIGNPETEPDFLMSRSPITKVDQIKIPMLIAQGANDPRVNQAESEQIVAAMKAKGIDHKYLLFPDEGHGFARPENRLKFYAEAEVFLAKYLGGRAEETAIK
jgi:dipeptidyl aminopeptidase/acylaminoacyl peptidase